MKKPRLNAPKLTAVFLFSILAGVGLAAQEFSVSPTASKPVADGKIADKEYQTAADYGTAVLYASLDTSGVLYLAMKSSLKGWAAIGLGSTKMNGASMFMGYVANGKAVFSAQQGIGHSHDISNSFKPLSEAMSLSADGTVYEFSVPLKDYMKDAVVPMIIAASNQASFLAMHGFRASIDLNVKK
jgi:hypothetical protein